MTGSPVLDASFFFLFGGFMVIENIVPAVTQENVVVVTVNDTWIVIHGYLDGQVAGYNRDLLNKHTSCFFKGCLTHNPLCLKVLNKTPPSTNAHVMGRGDDGGVGGDESRSLDAQNTLLNCLMH